MWAEYTEKQKYVTQSGRQKHSEIAASKRSRTHVK